MCLRRPLLLLSLVVGLGLVTGTPLLSAGARAAPAENASAFLQTLIDQALALIRDKQMPQDQREQRFAALFDQGFDVPRIARFVLGRYWTTASEADRANFTKLFEQWIVKTYSARFNNYSNQTVKISGARPESGTNTVVSSEIVNPNGGQPTKVDWDVRNDNGTYKIVDVDVEGVSMALTQRDEIAAVIQRNGGSVAGANQALQQKLAGGDTGDTSPRPQ